MKIEEGVDKITTSVKASSAPPVTTQVSTLAEAMVMVKECGVKEKTTLKHTTTLLIMKPEGSCDRTTSEMRGLSPKIILGDF
jgi:hypothetical protein